MYRSKKCLSAPTINIFHLLKEKDSSVEVSKTYTHVQQTVVKDFVWSVSKLIWLGLHLDEQLESSFSVLIDLADKTTIFT